MALRRRCLSLEDLICCETCFSQNRMQDKSKPGEHGWAKRISTNKTRREERRK